MQLTMVWRKPALEPPVLPAGFALRAYQPGDEESWTDAATALTGARMGVAEFRKTMLEAPGIKPAGILLAIETASGRAVGTATGVLGRPRPHAGYLHMVSVLPEYQNRGLGKALSRAVLHYLRQHDCAEVLLNTDDWRLPAISGYLRIGFQPVVTDDRLRFRWQLVLRQLGVRETPVSAENGHSTGTLAAEPLRPLPVQEGVFLVEPQWGVYLVERGNDAVLIDSSTALEAPAVLASLEAGGHRSRLRAILCTHCHLDHTGGASLLTEATGAGVHLHQADAACAENPDRFFANHAWEPEKYRAWMPRGITPCRLTVPRQELRFGAVRLEAIHTPGHTPGSVSYFLAGQQTLFPGDTLQYSASYQQAKWLGIIEDAQSLRESWDRLRALAAHTWLPSHGAFDVDFAPRSSNPNLPSDLDASIAFYDKLMEELREMIRGRVTLPDACERLKQRGLNAVNSAVERRTMESLWQAAGGDVGVR